MVFEELRRMKRRKLSSITFADADELRAVRKM
jgi:hypothetical protein